MTQQETTELEHELSAALKKVDEQRELLRLCKQENEEKRTDIVYLATEKANLENRIQLLEGQLMEVKNKHAVLVADVVLDDDRAERINHLETALRRIANQDYRGNRSTESQIAAEALEEVK